MSSKSLQVRSALAKVLRDASGFELDELNPNGTFLELGFDSLFLIQLSQRIKSSLGVKVTFRQLIAEVPTIDSLLEYLEKKGKWAESTASETPAILPPETSPTSTAVATATSAVVGSPAVGPKPESLPTQTSSPAILPTTEFTNPSSPTTSLSVASQPSESNLQRPLDAVVSNTSPTAYSNASSAQPGFAQQQFPSAVRFPEVPVCTQELMPSSFTPPSSFNSSNAPRLFSGVPSSSLRPGSLESIFQQQNQLMMMQLQLLRERRTISSSAGPATQVSAQPLVAQPMLVQPAIAESAIGQPAIATSPSNPTAIPTGIGNSESAISVAPNPMPATPDSSRSGPAVPAKSTAAQNGTNSGQKKVFERFGPYKPVRRSATGGLTDTQQKHLDEFVARFTKRTSKSRAHAQLHRDHFADPRGVAGYRRIWKSMVYQIAVARSAGSKLWDIDGNEYIDIAMGFGLNLFGQSPSFVTKALHEQLERGVEVGPQSPLAGEVAKLLCEFSRMDRATFCNTGSEAVMAAMRIARTVTGKTKCVFFNKDYHGNFDQVLLRSASAAGKASSSPAAPGVPQFYADNTIVLEYGTDESLRVIEQHADDIAAVLVEPVQSADPDLHPREFLHKLRSLTRDRNIVMVMDEVISGFRAAPGGAQEYFDVWGDMATYGKILGGGLPIGALAGKAQYMNALDGGTWKYEDSSEPEADMTFFAGTFVRHPLAMTAAYQILTRLKAEGPQLQQRLNDRTARMSQQINEFFVKEQIPIRLARFTSLFRFIFPPDLEYADMLYFHLLDRGIFTRGRGDNCFLSTEHSDSDIQRIVEAVKDSCLELRSAGFLPGGDDGHSGANGHAILTHQSKNSEVVVKGHPAEKKESAAPLRLHEKPFRASTLEEIQPEGDLPPLFCMPAADGLTLVYHELSECLGKNQPVYGLNSPGVYGEPLPETIEEMAERFIADIQEEFPDGPYLLCGYCSGGTIAFEVAQQLTAQGKQVAFLAGVETYNWCTAQSSQQTLMIKLIYQLQRFDYHLRNFILLPGGEKWKFLKSKWNALKARTRVWRGMIANIFSRSAKPVSTPGIVNHAKIWRQHDLQADRYRPRKYSGKMVIFRPKKDYSSYVAKEDLQAEGGLEIIRLPVYPAGLMVRPYVSQLAELLAQGIREGLAGIQDERCHDDPNAPERSQEPFQIHVA